MFKKMYNIVSSDRTNYVVTLIATTSWVLSAFFGMIGVLLSKNTSDVPRIIMCLIFAAVCFCISRYWKGKLRESAGYKEK